MAQHEHNDHSGALRGYIVGFVLSIVLTIIPLVLVLNHMMAKVALIATIMIIAVLQFLVQLFFFMHIREGGEDGPRYNVWGLTLGVFIVIVIVAGSIWIMTFNAQVA